MRPHPPRFRALHLVLLAALCLLACGAPAPVRPVESPRPVAEPTPAVEVAEAPGPEPDPGQVIPVTANEPAMGDPLAPVTWVLFGDYECRFTAKVFAQLDSFMKTYGAKQLRVVWRHFPISTHENARLYAVAANTVFRLGGAKAFWTFSASLFASQGAIEPKDLPRLARVAGVDSGLFAEALVAESYGPKVAEDIELGKELGVKGTPESYINGAHLPGAVEREKFVALLDAALAQAGELVESGVPREGVYAAAVELNYEKPEPPKAPSQDTTTVWKVALGGSPVRGKATAHVTLVMFSDFECPFCAKAHATIAALEREYGEKLRIVFKHSPLPFHPRAEPAAQLAIEARAQGGDAKFWQAYDLLFQDQTRLSDQDLDDHAKTLGLQVKRASAAIASRKHAATIEADLDLADELLAVGVPHFFINGRRLTGSQPIAMFKTIIDEEIAKADELLASGTSAAKLYETLQKDGRGPPPRERILVPAATAQSPAKGAKAGPKVAVVQVFSDFECPYCKSLEGTLDELITALPGKVRVVFRHRPISTHKSAQLAAEAAVEAFTQKGDKGFWAYSKLLWGDQTALDKESLITKATEAGLDATKMRTALDTRAHQAAVDADRALAESLKITSIPAVAVGDHFLQGAQPLHKFKKAVQRALGPADPPAPENLHGTWRAPGTAAPAPAPSAAAPAGATFGAKHLLVMYQGSNRAPATVTRTKAEALKRAKEARKRALAGEKFEDLVAEYSDEPGAGPRGGDLGAFPRGRMVETFQQGVEKTPVGTISDIVETPFGFHVILRTR
jgi:protein-disulfide isomerase